MIYMSLLVLCILGCLLTFGAMLVFMPVFIRSLKKKNISQVASEYALDEFKNKEKTPIMGGLLFVVIPLIVVIIIHPSILFERRLLFVALSYIAYCSVGFIDDYLIINSHSNDGLSAWTRIFMEFGYALILFILFRDVIPQQVTIPFFNIGIGVSAPVFAAFMILLFMAEANAVNFTDGMDGLCAGVSFIALLSFAVLAYLHQHADLLLLIICVEAGLLGYLRFNFHPAKIFMGDSGSLALGALFASLAIVMDKTIALFFIGGVFVIEMFCVVLQQLAVRLFHKRVFSYTPIHYAFVIKGYKEKAIVCGFYLLALVLAAIGLYVGIHTL